MQAEFGEAIKILRGIKRTMQARNIWVEEDEQNQSARRCESVHPGRLPLAVALTLTRTAGFV